MRQLRADRTRRGSPCANCARGEGMLRPNPVTLGDTWKLKSVTKKSPNESDSVNGPIVAPGGTTATRRVALPENVAVARPNRIDRTAVSPLPVISTQSPGRIRFRSIPEAGGLTRPGGLTVTVWARDESGRRAPITIRSHQPREARANSRFMNDPSCIWSRPIKRPASGVSKLVSTRPPSPRSPGDAPPACRNSVPGIAR